MTGAVVAFSIKDRDPKALFAMPLNLLGVSIIVYYYNCRTWLTDSSIIQRNFWGRKREMPYTDIVKIEAGTLVATETGYVTIENIKAGDLVWAHDPETGETTLKPVVQTFQNETTEWIHVTVNGETLTCTVEHPFYVPQKGCTSAIDLRAGDILVMLNGEYVVVEQVQHELLESPETTYNFEVVDFHTYYVGDTCVLVHNQCGDSPQSPGKLSKHELKGIDAHAFTDTMYSM